MTKMRNRLLEIGVKAIFGMKWQRTWLKIVLFYSVVEIELKIDELRHLAEKISNESVAWFLLATYGKIQEERDKFRKKLLSKEKKHTHTKTST